MNAHAHARDETLCYNVTTSAYPDSRMSGRALLRCNRCNRPWWRESAIVQAGSGSRWSEWQRSRCWQCRLLYKEHMRRQLAKASPAAKLERHLQAQTVEF